MTSIMIVSESLSLFNAFILRTPLGDRAVLLSPFSGWGSEAQSWGVTCPRSHRKAVAEQVIEPQSPDPRLVP